jgi:hypothetical protein
MKSAIFSGRVRHRRHTDGGNNFSYRVFMVYLDLAELDRVFAGSWLWSTSRVAAARFRRQDYLPGDANLDTAVRNRVQQETGARPSGPVRLLTNLRYFGHLINPISCYYCFNADDTAVETIVVEVTNTPWGERTSYVLPCDPSREKQRIAFDKAMHVSPFLPMDMVYHWYSNTPGQHLMIHLENHRAGVRLFDASLTLTREDISTASLRRVLWRFPWMTMKVRAAIYWQAFKLYCIKHVPFYSHTDTRIQRS